MAKIPQKSFDVSLKWQDQAAGGKLAVGYWTRVDAWRRATGCFAAIFAIGIMSIMNPFVMLHIIPPVWIIAAPYAAHRVFNGYYDSFQILKGLGLCPKCKVSTRLFPRGTIFPIEAACEHCHALLKVHPQTDVDQLKASLNDAFSRPINEGFFAHERMIDRFWMRATYASIVLFFGAYALLIWFLIYIMQ